MNYKQLFLILSMILIALQGVSGRTPLVNDSTTLMLCNFNSTTTCVTGETPILSQGVQFIDGLIANATYINGTSRTNLTYSATNNFQWQNGTLEFWFKPNYALNYGGAPYFFSTGNTALNLSTILIYFEPAGNKFIVFSMRNTTNGEAADYDSFIALNNNTAVNTTWNTSWHHYAVTWILNSTKDCRAVYLDGVSYSNKCVDVHNFNGLFGNLTIGNSYGMNSYGNNSIDEFMISNYPKSSSEIFLDYLAGSNQSLNGTCGVSAVNINISLYNDTSCRAIFYNPPFAAYLKFLQSNPSEANTNNPFYGSLHYASSITGNNANYASIYKFNFSAITDHGLLRNISSAYLYLGGTTPSGGSTGKLRVGGVASDWDYTNITYNNAPANASIFGQDEMSDSIPFNLTFNSTNLARLLLMFNGTNYGFKHITSVDLGNNDVGNVYNTPTLVMFYPIMRLIFLNVTLPVNNTNYTSNAVNYELNTSFFCGGDNSTFTVIQSLNGVVNYTNSSYSNSVVINRILNLSSGNYTIYTNCTDGIVSDSDTRFVRIISNQTTYVISYTNITNETNIELFSLNLSVSPLVNFSSARLYYNNTEYTPTKTTNYYNYSISIPFVNTNNTKQEFYWNYTLFYVDGSNTTFTTTRNNQTIAWKLFYPTLNITVYDQLAKEYLNTFTVNASNGTESYELTATAGNVTLITPMDAHNNKSFTIRAYNYVLNNYSTTYLMTYNTSASLVLMPTIGFNFRLLDEATTNSFNVSKPTSIQMQFFCTNQTQLLTVTQANFSYNISCEINKITTILTYPSASYYRTLPFDLITNYSMVKIWLIDALVSPYILNVFQIYDLLGVYTNPRVLITRIINSTEEPITGDFVDATNSISAYLIQNQNYNIKVTSSSLPDRIMGGYTATTSGSQILRLFDLQLAGTPTRLDATTQASTELTNSSGVFRIVTIVNSTTATGSSYKVYNSTGDEIFSSSSTNGNAAYTYTTSTNYSCTEKFTTNLTVVTPTGTYQTSKVLKGCNYVTNPAQFSNPNTLKFVIAFLIVILALALTIQTQQIGGLLIFAVVALLVAWGPTWLLGIGLISWMMVGLIGILMIWNAFKN